MIVDDCVGTCLLRGAVSTATIGRGRKGRREMERGQKRGRRKEEKKNGRFLVDSSSPLTCCAKVPLIHRTRLNSISKLNFNCHCRYLNGIRYP